MPHVPPLSAYSRRRKCAWFPRYLAPGARVLEVGCGDGWFVRYLREHGWPEARGIDLCAPADIVGDVRAWQTLGLRRGSFDALAAFEVLEHVDFLDAAHALLRPGGRLLLSTPVPATDPVCWLLERARLAQPRATPHCNLTDLRGLPGFERVALRRVGLLAQWGVFAKPTHA